MLCFCRYVESVCVCPPNQLVLELCRGSDPVDLQTIQPHLDRIKAPSSTAKDPHVRETT